MLAIENGFVLAATIADLLLLAGAIVYLIGVFKMMIVARRTGSFWFVGCLFSVLIPFYCILHWPSARKPCYVLLAGILLMLVGALVKPA